MTIDKPPITGTTHALPFNRLSPRDFERMCLWLVEREGYQNAEHLGASGGEQGRDIRARRGDQSVVFQCKRVEGFGPQDAIREVDKILGLPEQERPVELIFLVTCDVSVQARDAARQRAAGNFDCLFLVSTELDMRVKRYPDILTEFFQVPEAVLSYTHPPLPSRFTIQDPPLDFTGRQAEVEQLEAAFQAAPNVNTGTAVLISGITGGAGIGKTALARCLAQRIAGRYPDARLEIDLKGASRPPDQPLQPSDAMRRLLAPFFTGIGLPESPEELHSLYQDTFRRHTCLLLLDNAYNAAQLRPLIPHLPSASIVTSRTNFQLSEVGLRPLHLNPLDLDPARDLMRKISPRLEKQLDQDLDEISRTCERQPLALRVAASVFEDRPDWTLPELLFRLQNERTRLSTLQHVADADLDIIASFELSYLTLPPTLQSRFRSLGIFPSPFDKQALAAVWEATAEISDQANQDIGNLLTRNLLDYRPATSDFSLHDLVRLYCQKLLLDRTDEAILVLQRHAMYYLEQARIADDLYLQGGENIQAAITRFTRLWHHLATNWLRISDPQSGWPSFGSSENWLADFPNRMINVLDLHITPRQKLPYLERAISASIRIGDRHTLSVNLGNLGTKYRELGEPKKAKFYLNQALRISREIGDRRGEGADFVNLGITYMDLGNTDRAIECYKNAMEIAHQIGDRRLEGAQLGNMGTALARLGKIDDAIDSLKQAIEIFHQENDLRNESKFLGNLGISYANKGELDHAIDNFTQAQETAHLIGDFHTEGLCLNNLGLTYKKLGNNEKACLYYYQALEMFETILGPNHPETQIVRDNLSKLSPST